MKHWLARFNGHFYHFESIDSTQSFIHRHPTTDKPIICIAAQQNKGIGQRGSTWESPKGQIYVSLQKKMNLPIKNLQGLTQQIALLLCQLLDQNEYKISLKWPNDLFIKDRKLAGILVETKSFNQCSQVAIGMGINLNRQADNNYAYYSDIHDPEQFNIENILSEIFNTLEDWESTPYLPLGNDWQNYDRFYQQTCVLQDHEQPMQLLGIDQNGRLIAKDHHDQLHFLTQTRIKSCIS